MSWEKIYTIATDTLNGSVVIEEIEEAIAESTISPVLDCILVLGPVLKLVFATEPDASEKTTLDGIVANHAGDALGPYKNIIHNAIIFFAEIMEIFAAENITMGITFYGKTKDVADYLQDVLRYGQSGSLYEVSHEIDELKLAGVPAGLSPFVTDERLDDFKAKITDYLS